jgi:hypothetical protein
MSEMNRREFAECLALAALAPVLGTGVAPLGLPGLEVAAADSGALARALAGAIRAEYGDRLSDPDLAVITRQIEAYLERAATLRKVRLANGDAPG